MVRSFYSPVCYCVIYAWCNLWRMGIEQKSAAYASFGDVALLVLFAFLLLAGIWSLVTLIGFLWRHS